jgi:hypothetical protein
VKPGTLPQKTRAGLLLLAVLALAWYSFQLASNRIYQVDECQNLYMAKALAVGRGGEFFTSASLFLFGPLSWMARSAIHSAELFSNARMLFLGVFWLNVILIASAAAGGNRLLSLPGLIFLLGASTLAPLWDYGFEIRHDNLILTGILLIWWAARVRPMGVVSYLIAGAVGVVVLFIAVKAVVYIVPLWFLILVFPPPAHHCSRWRLGLSWALGVLVTGILIRIAYGNGGLWEKYLAVFYWTGNYSATQGEGARSAPWGTLARLIPQTPLLLAIFFAAVISLRTKCRSCHVASAWEGHLPEMLLLFIAVAALFVNPTPFPYNLVNLVPFLFITVCGYARQNRRELGGEMAWRPVVAGVIIFAHLAPFAVAAQRHTQFKNSRQELLMRLAEDLSDPQKDPVYDGIGMVPTRRSIHHYWYLHSLNIRSFIDGSKPRVREMLSACPAVVFIPNYRTDWLPEEDHSFVRDYYVPLASDFWVLGQVLPPGGGAFKILHPGRYRIVALERSGPGRPLCGTEEGLAVSRAEGVLCGTIDGLPVSQAPVLLVPGLHRIETPAGCRPAVVWVGPRLDQVPRLEEASHRKLFVNWY